MELENIVANTVYLKAREGGPDNSKGRSKKWKKLMNFPHISQCIHLQDSLPAKNYDYIVDQQPLGMRLFRQFCVNHKQEYYHYNEFLDAAEAYEIEWEDTRPKTAANIVKKHLTRPGDDLANFTTIYKATNELARFEIQKCATLKLFA